MTIVAGFRCTNGIVMCSDTEYSHGESHKTYGTKIAHFVKPHFSFVLSAAGNPGFMERVFDEFADKLETAIPNTMKETTDIFEDVLRDLYQKHIFPIPNWEKIDADAQFLVAIRTPDGKQDLLGSSITILSKAGEYECKGAGADVGMAVIDMAAYPSLSVAEAVILSIHALERVKTIAAYCGGASTVIIQEPTGITREKKFRDISEIEKSLRDLQAEITPLLLSWADESLPEEQFRERLDRVTDSYANVILGDLRPVN
jgi:hypothetical protein